MSPNQPPRRFAPTPLETTTKSSRQGSQTNGETPRKFNAQPIETTIKSSKESGPLNGEADPNKQTLRRSPPQPVETSRKSSKDVQQVLQNARRFAPQPIETSAKSSRDKQEAPRRFAPQPVETSTKSSRNNSTTEKPKSRFLPQPIETSTKSSRANVASEEPLSPTAKPPTASSDKPAKRKFAPQLLDTSARSRKSTDSRVVSAADKTDHIAGVKPVSYNNCGQKFEHDEMPSSSTPEHLRFLMPFERRKERPDSRNSTRSHSFRLPDLETIESSESEPSNPPSLSTSPSSNDNALNGPLSEMYRHATRIRESVDETFGRYLLELEARRAQQKLQDQALAAFPNSDFHEPVAHYVDEESEEDEIDDRPATWEGHDDDDDDGAMNFARSNYRREATHGTFEVREMQQHHEELEQERKAANTTARRRSSGISSSPWWNPAAHDFAGSVERDPELKPMRDRARPPMLGADLRFPRSASPEPARFDVTQGSNQLRSQMCYLTEQTGGEVSPEGLWGGKKQKSSHQLSQKSTHSNKSTLSAAGQERKESDKEGGLWGGFCVYHPPAKDGLVPPRGPSGLMTPRLESGNPFEVPSGWKLPPPTTLPVTPPTTEEQGPQIDIILSDDQELDQLMEKEYPDSFVTQVYNYLSLGYPSLARPFDEELTKISQVPISDLRHDDEIAKEMPKGYIRLGDDFEGRGDGIDQELEEGGCARWKALKLYIREWARQEKNMVKTEGLGEGGNWGTGARRGSWAW